MTIKRNIRLFFALAAVLIWVTAAVVPIHRGEAMEIQRVAVPGGAEAWLVEEHGLPIVFVEIFWRAGSASEAEHLTGLVYMLSGLLDEGAGDLDSATFQERLEDLNIDLGFRASKDTFFVSLRTLEENLDEAFALLSLALTQPRFDDEAVERVRAQILAGLKQEDQEPEVQAARAWFAAAFPGHPYGRPPHGTPESIRAVKVADMRDWLGRALAWDNMGIAAVGDITAERLAQGLGKSLADLPSTSAIQPPGETHFQASGHMEVISHPNPQSVIRFGHGGIKRKDPDFIAAYVMNNILGGSVLVSRLGDEVREKRGLAYSVYTHLYSLDHAGLLIGSLATENSRAGTALEQVKFELTRMRNEGVGEEELENAKTYLIGSYPLRFDSSEKIAEQLAFIQREGLGIDYIEERNGMIAAIDRGDILRVAQRLLDPEELSVVMVGEPQLADSP